MHIKNQLEHQRILDDLASIRSCITNFTGYVLGGSGVLATVLALASDGKIRAPEIAFAALFGSVVISFVMLVLMYKFNSHNRLAAYTKVMSHENFGHDPTSGDFAIVIWDICIGRLMHYSKPDQKPEQTCKSVERLFEADRVKYEDMGGSQIKSLTKLVYYLTVNSSPVDHNKTYNGLKMILRTLGGRVNSQSWSYPAYITLIFLLIVLVLLFVGGLSTYFDCTSGAIRAGTTIPINWVKDLSSSIGCTTAASNSTESTILLMTCLLVALIQLFMWKVFIGKLHCLMQGTSTIDSFFWRFLAIRGRVISQMGISIKYGHIESWLRHSLENQEDQIQQFANYHRYEKIFNHCPIGAYQKV